MTTKTVLVTAFEPFGGQRVNASELAVRPLDGRMIAGHRVVVAILPCLFGDAMVALRRAVRRARPALVVACGEAGGRAVVSLERVAINIEDAGIPDNAGVRPVDRAIAPHGPAAYWSGLPIKAIVAKLKKRGIPAAVSDTAGTFVCNHVFYALMRMLAASSGRRGGFVHVPYAPEQACDRLAAMPTLPTAIVTAAIEVVIATALKSYFKFR